MRLVCVEPELPMSLSESEDDVLGILHELNAKHSCAGFSCFLYAAVSRTHDSLRQTAAAKIAQRVLT